MSKRSRIRRRLARPQAPQSVVSNERVSGASSARSGRIGLLSNQRIDMTHFAPEAATEPRSSSKQKNRSKRSPSSLEANSVAIHAAELAQRLREKQAELDRREAILNSRTAKFEDDQRQARVHEEHCSRELLDERTRLVHKTQRLDEKERQIVVAEDGLEQENQTKINDLKVMQSQLDQQEANLHTRQAQLTKSLSELQQQKIEWTQASGQKKSSLDAMFDQLEYCRALLDQQHQQWNQRIESHTAEHTRLMRSLDQRGIEHEEAQQETQRRIQQREEALERRVIELAAKEESVELLFKETVDFHQSTLEDRMVLEKIWGEVQQNDPTGQWALRVAGLKEKLSHVLERIHQRMESRKKELQSLLVQLETRGQQLDQKKIELSRWLDERYELIAARERSVQRDCEENTRLSEELKKSQLKWKHQRDDYERQIRRLVDQNIAAYQKAS